MSKKINAFGLVVGDSEEDHDARRVDTIAGIDGRQLIGWLTVISEALVNLGVALNPASARPLREFDAEEPEGDEPEGDADAETEPAEPDEVGPEPKTEQDDRRSGTTEGPAKRRTKAGPDGPMKDRVMRLLDASGSQMTVSEVAGALGTDSTTAAKRLSDLHRKGKVERVSQGVYKAARS